MSLSPASQLTRPFRWVVFTLLTLGFVIAGLPATSASAAADGILTGTVTFHESSPIRTLEVYRETVDGSWAADDTLTTAIPQNGAFSAHVPAGEAVKLRVSYGDAAYGYWYGDGFNPDQAQTVQAAGGKTVKGLNLSVPAPSYLSGRLLDRSGNPIAGSVVPYINNDGSMAPIAAPVAVDQSGEYSVILPADHEDSVMGLNESGDTFAWLLGGTGYEPDWYTNTTADQTLTSQDIKVPVGSASAAPDTTKPSKPAATTKLRAVRTPVVHGAVRKGHRLHSTTGSYNKRPTTVRYQWLRNGKAIHGATASSYKLKKADVRKHIRVRVTAIRSGVKVRAMSARTTAVRAR